MARQLLLVMLIGAMGTAATAAGGALALAGSGSKNFTGCVMEFAAGLMISISVFGLIPEAAEIGGAAALFAGFIFGALSAALTSRLIERSSRFETTLKRVGVMSAVGIAAHNFFEGVACGSGFLVSDSFGIALLAAIALHDIPEGMALAAPLGAGNKHKGKIILCAAACGAPTILGAAAGASVGGISAGAVGFCLAAAAGTMITISFADIIPNAKSIGSLTHQSLLDVAGIMAGYVLSKI